MADASKLKSLRRSGLGAPPAPEEARTDLAPTLLSHPVPIGEPAPVPAASGSLHRSNADPSLAGRVDGRTMRRSGRTVQFATRVSPEFDERIRRIAMQDGMLLVEVLERALDAYEASRQTAST